MKPILNDEKNISMLSKDSKYLDALATVAQQHGNNISSSDSTPNLTPISTSTSTSTMSNYQIGLKNQDQDNFNDSSSNDSNSTIKKRRKRISKACENCRKRKKKVCIYSFLDTHFNNRHSH